MKKINHKLRDSKYVFLHGLFLQSGIDLDEQETLSLLSFLNLMADFIKLEKDEHDIQVLIKGNLIKDWIDDFIEKETKEKP